MFKFLRNWLISSSISTYDSHFHHLFLFQDDEWILMVSILFHFSVPRPFYQELAWATLRIYNNYHSVQLNFLFCSFLVFSNHDHHSWTFFKVKLWRLRDLERSDFYRFLTISLPIYVGARHFIKSSSIPPAVATIQSTIRFLTRNLMTSRTPHDAMLDV